MGGSCGICRSVAEYSHAVTRPGGPLPPHIERGHARKMANDKQKVAEIVSRCRRVGWGVETGNGRQDWIFRITCPPDDCKLPKCTHRVQIHGSPSDIHWDRVVWRDLNGHGFEKAESTHLAKEEADRMARIEQDRRKNDEQTAKAAKHAAAVAKAAGEAAGPQPLTYEWLTRKTDIPETRVGILMPDIAARLVDKVEGINTHNRKMQPLRVAYFEGLIRRKEFRRTHQGGATDRNGVMQDGQTRCQAVANVGQPVEIQWSIGMPPENFTALDSGSMRSARDVAYIMGEPDPSISSATAKMLLMVEEFGPDAHVKYRGTRVSNDAVGDALQMFGQELRDAVNLAKAIKKSIKRVNPTAVATAIYMIGLRLPAGDPRVEQFWYDVRFGEGLKRTDPVWHLTRLLLNADSGRRGYNSWEQLAYILKAWNKRAEGVEVRNLSWQPARESFPCEVVLPPPIAGGKGSNDESAA